MRKKVDTDRDQPIERLLRNTLGARLASSPPGPCLDAETAAAWADEALSVPERTAAEAHAADCMRCQALLAAMAKTSPPMAARSFWRLPAAGWLVPLTAATAAAIVWAILPGRTPVDANRPLPSPSTVATVAKPAANAPPALERQQQQQGPVGGLRATPRSNALLSAPAPIGRRDAGAGPSAGLNNVAQKKLEKVADTAARSAAALPAPSPVVAGESSAPTPATTPASAQQSAAVLAPVAAEGASGRGGAIVGGISGPEKLIVSTNSSIRWRIVPGRPGLPGRAVQRSTNGGSSWETQPTGATAMLVAGTSPSPSVCWLVGSGGTVLLSTDGRSWQRVTFPETTDLVSVRATDDKTATVTGSDGRTFSTKDGGLTWVRVPGI